MCSQYGISPELMALLKTRISEVEFQKITVENVFPKMYAPVLLLNEYRTMKWGFIESWTKKPLFNARSETILEKESFREYYIKNKCVILATSFYEYDESHIRYEYSLNGQIIYMAGFYKKNDSGEDEYTIITQEAPSRYQYIHNRIPLVLKKEEVELYLKSVDENNWLRPRNPTFKITPKQK